MDWVGKRIGKFEIRRVLGSGGMGTVYAAAEDGLEREVALKVLPEGRDQPDLVKRFLRESSVCARLSHPSIVRILDYGHDEGVYYYAMELLQATGLDRVLASQTVQPLEKMLSLGRDVLSAFQHMHAQGVVHRDVKPSNIMIDAAGRAILTDFGLVKDLMASRITRSDMVLGSPQFVSPEIVMGREVGPRSDIYQLGVVLYRMATGGLPFRGDTSQALLLQVVSGDVRHAADRAPSLPVGVADVIMKCMAKLPDERYQTAVEAAAALEAAAGNAKSAETRATHRSDPVGGPPRSRSAAAARQRGVSRASSVAAGGRRPGQQSASSFAIPPAAPARHARRPVLIAAATGLLLLGAVVLGLGRLGSAPATESSTSPSSAGPPQTTQAAEAADPSAKQLAMELDAAARELSPGSRSEALDDNLRDAGPQERQRLLEAAVSRSKGSRLGALIRQARKEGRSLLPADLDWPLRCLVAGHVFEILRFDLVHDGWSSAGRLGWREALAPTLGFAHTRLCDLEETMTDQLLEESMARSYPATGPVLILRNQRHADNYTYENARESYLPDFLSGAFRDAFDEQGKILNESPLRPFSIPADSGELRFVAFLFDVDYRAAILLRLKPEAGGPELPVPLTVLLPPQETRGWFLAETRLAAGALPPGRYRGRLSAFRIMSRFHSRPNVLAVYVVPSKS